jgi:hypothetical protein
MRLSCFLANSTSALFDVKQYAAFKNGKFFYAPHRVTTVTLHARLSGIQFFASRSSDVGISNERVLSAS